MQGTGLTFGWCSARVQWVIESREDDKIGLMGVGKVGLLDFVDCGKCELLRERRGAV